MPSKKAVKSINQISSRRLARAALVAVAFTLIGAAILAVQLPGDGSFSELQAGEVAPQTIVAPKQISYVSTIDTNTARDRARNSIPTQFSPPDPQVARNQVSRLVKIFDYLDTVRADTYGSRADKFEWIDAIPEISVSDTIIDQILIMPEQNWTITRKEAIRLLDSTMRDEIKETQILSKRRELPNKVALDIPQDQAEVIVAITSALIAANTFPDVAKTDAEREAAAAAIEPVTVTIEQDELIIPAGRVIGPKEIEILEALGLQHTQRSMVGIIVPALVLMILATIFQVAYIIQYNPGLIDNGKRLAILTGLSLLFMAVAKVMIPDTSDFVAYFYPVAALTMMLAMMIDSRIAMISAVIMAVSIGYLASANPEQLFIYALFSGWVGIVALGKRPRVNNLIWAGLYVALVNASLITIFNLPGEATLNTVQVGQLMLSGLLNGVFAAGLALIGLFAIGNLLGITTSIQLQELSRPTPPLLRQLLLKAPGTYHHSLMVSNLAEQAAERIGADSMLVRVMAYYHDIGKMQRPYFFIENQPVGMANVHERLDPQISARIIISHVLDGMDLAEKYRLPQTLKDGIAQHHGTGLVRFFYYQALEAAKKNGSTIEEANFCYPGPKPQTKETGVLMLADVSETTVRALKPGSAAEIDEIVRKAITHHLDTGQLDECDLTIADLHQIRTAFVDILQGIHHPRIKYPEQLNEEASAQAQLPPPNPAADSTQMTPPARSAGNGQPLPP
jgi:putative nucleotidyltransferase with HDIG domain